MAGAHFVPVSQPARILGFCDQGHGATPGTLIYI